MQLSKIFNNTDSTKNKILEADLNLQKYMRISQSTEKLLTPYCMTIQAMEFSRPEYWSG